MKGLDRSRIPYRRREDGATSVEYALLLFLITAVIIGAAFTFGDNASELYTCTRETVTTKVPSC